MLDVIVDSVGREKRTSQRPRLSRAGVAERVVVSGGGHVLGDAAEPRHELISGRQGQEPKEHVNLPVAQSREGTEEGGVGGDRPS